MDKEKKKFLENTIDAYRDKCISYKREILIKEEAIEKLKGEIEIFKAKYERTNNHLIQCLKRYDEMCKKGGEQICQWLKKELS